MKRIIERIVQTIRDHDSFCIVGHVRPDGDCIGSELGLAYALRNAGKTVTVWNEDPMPRKLAFLDPSRLLDTPKQGKAFDCVIATDCASFERLGKIGNCITNRKVFINIDHHTSNTRYADLNWISDSDPSTGELIYRLLQAGRWPITPEIADCLFTAVSTDTGSFQYPSTRPATYHVAAHLVERGANLEKISNEVYQSYPLSRVRLLRHVYSRFKLDHDDEIAYFWLRKIDFSRTGAGPEDAEGLIDHIRAIEPVVVACLFEEVTGDITRVSLRSKSDKVDVNEIAKQFGGGGHPAAAGARVPGRGMTTQRRVVNAIKKALKRAR